MGREASNYLKRKMTNLFLLKGSVSEKKLMEEVRECVEIAREYLLRGACDKAIEGYYIIKEYTDIIDVSLPLEFYELKEEMYFINMRKEFEEIFNGKKKTVDSENVIEAPFKGSSREFYPYRDDDLVKVSKISR